jgi:hypothetical protein
MPEKFMSKKHKPYSQMTKAALAKATRKYDRPFGGWHEFKPLTSKDRALHRKAAHSRRDRKSLAD